MREAHSSVQVHARSTLGLTRQEDMIFHFAVGHSQLFQKRRGSRGAMPAVDELCSKLYGRRTPRTGRHTGRRALSMPPCQGQPQSDGLQKAEALGRMRGEA